MKQNGNESGNQFIEEDQYEEGMAEGQEQYENENENENEEMAYEDAEGEGEEEYMENAEEHENNEDVGEEYDLQQLNNLVDLSTKPVIIVGNKCDLSSEREVTYEEGKEYAQKHGYSFYETSAKTGENVKEAFNDIFEKLYKLNEEEIIGQKEKKGNLNLNKKNKKKKKFC